MRKYHFIVCLLAAIAIATTGFAGKSVDTGPPATITLHKAFLNVDHFDAILVSPAIVRADRSADSYPCLDMPVQSKVVADIPPVFTPDKVGWKYAITNVYIDLNAWREQIKPLLAAQSRYTVKQGYPLLA